MSSAMRIGVDVRELEQDKRTGIGRFLTNLFHSELFRRASHEWVLFGNQRTVFPDGFSAVTVPERSRLLWDHVVLPQHLRRQGVRLFVSPYRKAPLWLPCPCVITIHDLFPFSVPGRRRLGDLLFWWFMRQTARRAERILTVSEFVKHDIVARLGVSPDKVRVLYHGLEPHFHPGGPDAGEDARLHTMGLGGQDVLFVGQLKPHKHVHTLIEAYARLPASLQVRHRLTIVGSDGSYRRMLETLIAQHGLKASVRFLGPVDDQLLAALYRRAAACVLPSEHEGFGLPAVEAMACGCPVIVARATALPEIVGEAGVFIDPQRPETLVEAMTEVLTDGKLRETLRDRGLVRSKQFSLERAVEQFLRVVDEVASECRSS